MYNFRNEELDKALFIISSTISNCEKIQPKFEQGTAQHSLLKNRIKALYISKSLILGEFITDQYTEEELVKALPPIASIISKSEKALIKSANGTSNHTHLKNIINAMYISKTFLTAEIEKKEQKDSKWNYKH